MALSFLMLRNDDRYAVKIVANNEEVKYLTPWYDRPERAAKDARAWMDQHREAPAGPRQAERIPL